MYTPLVRFYEMPAEWAVPKYDPGHVRYLVPSEKRRQVARVGKRLISQPETIDEFVQRMYRDRNRENFRKFLSLRDRSESKGEFLERMYGIGGAWNDADDFAFLARMCWLAETFQDPSLGTATAKLDVSTEITDALESPSKRGLPHYRALRDSLRFNWREDEIVVDKDLLAYKIRKEEGWKFWRVIPRMFFGEDPRLVALIEATGNRVK